MNEFTVAALGINHVVVLGRGIPTDTPCTILAGYGRAGRMSSDLVNLRESATSVDSFESENRFRRVSIVEMARGILRADRRS